MNIFRQLLRLCLLLLACGGAMAQTITVYGGGGKVEVAAQRQLTAYVPLTPNTVVWTVNGIPGGNAMVGTISASGLYVAPAAVPTDNVVTVRATSTAFPAKFDDTTLTILRVAPKLWSISPATVAVGPFTIGLNGADFTEDVVVRFGGMPLATTRLSSTRLTATGTATAAMAGTRVIVRVEQTGHGANVSTGYYVNVSGSAPPPIAVAVAPTSVSLTPLATQAFTANVSGSSNTAVSWSVNGIAGGHATIGTISAAGLYTAPAAVPSPASVTVRATAAANGTSYAQATVTIAAAPGGGGGGSADLAASRLLEQAAFGPNAASVARVKQLGVAGWLDEQFAMAETPIPVPATDNRLAQSQYLNRLSEAPDQLRQRVAYALSQIIVVSINKNNYPDQIVPYLQILSRNAFGNYRTLLGEITTSPQMGKYLDLARSTKPGAGGAANENYARELLQLFTIGLYKLNPDGSTQQSGGSPVGTYTQDEVQQLARALTGWVYINNDWENFTGPMVPREVNHDTAAKSFLGCNLPAGQTTQQDTSAALDCIFAHPNVGPFVVTRLIRALVTSNPTPAYVQRMTAVFNNNGSGVRGDLRATVRAILTDAEARNDAATPTSGRLKDPIFHILSIARALGGSITATNQQAWSFSRTGQTPLAPPSVFGFWSPMFRVPQSSLHGPEFQIYSPTEAVLRGNFIWQILSNPGSDFPVSIQSFVNLGGNTAALVEACNQTLLYGRMPAEMRTSITTAVNAQQGDNRDKALTALYLTLLSGQHAIQY
jgi:uncharacterized protein (DUF1800 family)